MLSSEIKHTFYFLYKLIRGFCSPLSSSSRYKDLKIGVGGKDPMQNFSLLSQLLESNAACTKFGVIKCRIAPPPYQLQGKFWKSIHSYKNSIQPAQVHQNKTEPWISELSNLERWLNLTSINFLGFKDLCQYLYTI